MQTSQTHTHYIYNLSITYTLSRYRGDGMQEKKRQEGKNEGKNDRGRGRNHPPQRRQLMRIWNMRIWEEEQNRKQKEEQKKETGSGPPTQLPGPFIRLVRPAWIIRWV